MGSGCNTIMHSNALKPDHYRDHVSSDSSSNLKTAGFLTSNEQYNTLIQKRRIPFFISGNQWALVVKTNACKTSSEYR